VHRADSRYTEINRKLRGVNQLLLVNLLGFTPFYSTYQQIAPFPFTLETRQLIPSPFASHAQPARGKTLKTPRLIADNDEQYRQPLLQSC